MSCGRKPVYHWNDNIRKDILKIKRKYTTANKNQNIDLETKGNLELEYKILRKELRDVILKVKKET